MKARLKPLILPVTLVCGLTLAACLCAAALLRGLGSLLTAAGEAQFGAIFSQLADARLFVPFWVPLVPLSPVGLLLYVSGRKRRTAPRAVLLVLCGILLFLLALAAALWFTDVNGIRVGRVVTTLLSYFGNGIADSM